jgi:glycosidase
MKRFFLALVGSIVFAPLGASAAPDPATVAAMRARLPEDETIYFLLPDRFENGDPANDRGGLKGDRMQTGFDPASKGFYNGGDLNGLTARLGYIQDMGVTAIWLGPIFKNKPVQGGAGQESAGYHGYWVTDFTAVDPHLGTNADFRTFVDAAHARGMKVYMDIIVNHTADVIAYKECPNSSCAYRSRADYPYQRRGGPAGIAINPGFAGDQVQAPENFAKLTDLTFAYTPYIPKGEAQVKVPAWLNDISLYHNRGNTTFTNESSTMGDFVGLDDVMTEHPKVIAGMIDIFGGWIDRYGIDGFRIDTAKHVNPEFWTAFAPAMLERAKAKGIRNFHIFGEVASGEMDPALLATWTRTAKLPAVLDFAFRAATLDAIAGNAGTDIFERLYDADALYEGGAASARRLPTFISNHDNGRFAFFVRKALPQASDEEVLKRVVLAHAMLLILRGVPTVYSGDEQGFVGDGNDQDAREPLFASKVASYNDNKLVGTTATTAQSNFNPAHPIYRAIAGLARIRAAEPALRRGTQILRARQDKPGLFAVSRILDGREVLLAFNTSTVPISENVEVGVDALRFTALHGPCVQAASAPGSVRVTIAPLDYVICASGGAR